MLLIKKILHEPFMSIVGIIALVYCWCTAKTSC